MNSIKIIKVISNDNNYIIFANNYYDYNKVQTQNGMTNNTTKQQKGCIRTLIVVGTLECVLIIEVSLIQYRSVHISECPD